MVRSNFGAVRLPLLAAAVLASFAVSLSAQVVEKGRTYADLVATHPCNSGNSGRLARVTDAQSSSSIGGGGGSTQVWAVCNGVDTWTLTTIGGSGGGGVDLSAYALLAGDEDGQTIQGLTGNNKARIELSPESEPEATRLVGGGAANTAVVFADRSYAVMRSPDTNTDCSVTNGAVSCSSDSSVAFAVNPTGGYFGADLTGFYAGSGAERGASIDVGKTVVDQAALIGGGATHGFIYAYEDGVYGESPDGLTSFDLYNGGLDLTTNGAVQFYGDTSTNLGSTTGWTAVNGSRVNVTSLQTPPTNADDPCTAGDTIDSATFHYYCAATDTWVRVAMATW